MLFGTPQQKFKSRAKSLAQSAPSAPYLSQELSAVEKAKLSNVLERTGRYVRRGVFCGSVRLLCLSKGHVLQKMGTTHLVGAEENQECYVMYFNMP